jgi:hypothetical protein
LLYYDANSGIPASPRPARGGGDGGMLALGVCEKREDLHEDLFTAGWAGTAREGGRLPLEGGTVREGSRSCPERQSCRYGRGGGFARITQCCQVAEIPAKKLKGGRRRKKLAERICGRILADFTKKWQKRGHRSSLFLAVITTYNVHQDKIKFDF